MANEKQNELRKLRKKDAKALLVLQQAVSDAIFPRIVNTTKSHEAWIILKQKFHGDNKKLHNKEIQKKVAIMVEAEEEKEEEEGHIGTMKKLITVKKQNPITKGSNAIFVTNMATLKKAVGKRQNNKQILLKNRSKKKNGIRRQLAVQHSPEQNSVAERKNRTVVEMAQSMLQGKMLPNEFLAEAVTTSVHLLNISPTKAVRNMTPFEAWYQTKPEAVSGIGQMYANSKLLSEPNSFEKANEIEERRNSIKEEISAIEKNET
ncbi:uncharacterized protein [Elaeis guineensis]|uniref:uncharacterized protein isoform X2 n=1 Tax=Elaeis guineensis var. tenera TaxID=51953 RepID=UPI003C6D977B